MNSTQDNFQKPPKEGSDAGETVVLPRIATLSIFIVFALNVACFILTAFPKIFTFDRWLAVYATSSGVDLILGGSLLAGFVPLEFYRLKVWISAGFFSYWFYCVDRPVISLVSMVAWISMALLGTRMPKPGLLLFSVLAVFSMFLWNVLIYNYGC